MTPSRKIRPPVLGAFILEKLLYRSIGGSAIGDFTEQYGLIVERKNLIVGWIWYWAQVMQILPQVIVDSLYWSLLMIKSYLVVALRNFKKQKVFALINISGLAVGMAIFAFFTLSSAVKLNADRFHVNGKRIYSYIHVLEQDDKDLNHTGWSPAPLAPALKEAYPEIEEAVRVHNVGRLTIRRNDESFHAVGFYFVDPAFLDIFSFNLVAGDPETALDEPFSIILTEAAAFKYFGETNPIGQVLTLNGDVQVTVKGILENVMRTSSMRFNFLVSLETGRSMFEFMDDWSANPVITYLMMPEQYHPREMDAKLPAFIESHYDEGPESPQQAYLFPFRDLRLKGRHLTHLIKGVWKPGLFITSIIGMLFLAIVSINFINLTIARQMFRTKEVGMRKVVGARRGQLIRQFLSESIFMSFLALPLAILIYELAEPNLAAYLGSMNPVTGLEHTVSNSIFNYPFLLKYLVIATLLTGFVSGLYPAFALSAFRPVDILSNRLKKDKKGRGRKALIVVQFSFSIILIVAAGVMKDQLFEFWNADLGFERGNVAMVLTSELEPSQIQVLRNEVARHPDVIFVSASARPPFIWEDKLGARPVGTPEENAVEIGAYGVDYGFPALMRVPIVEGRTFQKGFGDEDSFIINKTAVERLGLENPMGSRLLLGDKEGIVIGISEDYIFEDIGFEVPPGIMYLEQEHFRTLLVRYREGVEYREIEEDLKSTWLSIYPDQPFHGESMDDHFYNFFGMIIKIADMIRGFGLLAVFFSCLGLFGLSSFVAERRTKEVGIRKVLGASIPVIIWNLIREFLILVGISLAIAFPIIYFAWQQVIKTGVLFLEQIGPGAYLFAGGVTVITAMAAVISQTWKTVKANPVDSLRYE